jgi:hypothetical protein
MKNKMKVLLTTLAVTVGFTGFAPAQKCNKVPQTKIIMTINSPIDTAFNYIVPVDLAHIFKRYKIFPAIVNTSIKESWIKPGLKRTVYFDDGTTAEERLLTVIPNTSFSYEIQNFTSKLRFLAKKIEGEWQFIDLGDGQTKIEWTYKVVPKNFIAQGYVNILVMKNVKGLLNNAALILKEDLESGKYKNANH